jgi:transcription elongation factor Elf1
VTDQAIRNCPYCLKKNRIKDSPRLAHVICGSCKNPLQLNRSNLRQSILNELYDEYYNRSKRITKLNVESEEIIQALEYLKEKNLIKIISTSSNPWFIIRF